MIKQRQIALLSARASASPSRATEVRHSTTGRTCHHFQRYGLTCDEYDALRARAAGSCELCGTAETEVPGGRLVIDHCYEPWAIRGLLCPRCNSVMACHDGRKAWGPHSLALAGRAADYHRRAVPDASSPRP